MLCIELTRNGMRLATAGLPGERVVSLIFHRVLSEHRGPKEDRAFRLGGLDTSTDPETSLHWAGGDVPVGDEFLVRFLDLDSADEPAEREPSKSPTPTQLRRFRERQLRHLEAEVTKVRALLRATQRRTPERKSSKGR